MSKRALQAMIEDFERVDAELKRRLPNYKRKQLKGEWYGIARCIYRLKGDTAGVEMIEKMRAESLESQLL